jgi:hypothetical protein
VFGRNIIEFVATNFILVHPPLCYAVCYAEVEFDICDGTGSYGVHLTRYMLVTLPEYYEE